MGTPAGTADIVREAARAHEPDRYLAALLAPAAVRDDLIALAAFAGEIGHIPRMVSEPMMGLIRLQWWREHVVEAADGAGSGHPVAGAMVLAADRHRLPRPALERIIDATEQLLREPAAVPSALVALADARDGTLFELSDRICGSALPPTLLTAAGRAYGLARMEGFTAALGPAEQTAVRETLRAALAAAAPAMRAMRRRQRLPLLPVALVGPYLRVQQSDREMDRLRIVSPLSRIGRIAGCYWTGRIDTRDR